MNSYTLEIAQKIQIIHHSQSLPSDEEMDNLIGIDNNAFENDLSILDLINEYGPEHRTYQADTSYSYIQRIYQILAPFRLKSFLDLGSGNGRILFYGALLYPNIKFHGIELIPERVSFCRQLSQKMGLSVNFVNGNVFKEDLPVVECICLINSFFPSMMPQMISQLKKLAAIKPFLLVSASTCNIIISKQDWIQEVNLTPLPAHEYELRLFQTII